MPGQTTKRITINAWRIGTLALLNSTILIHYYLWHHLGFRKAGHSDPAEFFEFLRDGVARPFAVIFVFVSILTVVLGRSFCGWFCHMGSWQDGARWLMDRKWRWLKPVHSSVTIILPALCLALPLVGAVVYWTQHGFPAGVRFERSTLPVLDVGADWYTFGVIFLLVAVNQAFFGSRAICRFFCPLGQWLKMFDAFSKMRIRRTKDLRCSEDCLQCNRHCRMGIDVNFQVARYGKVEDLQCVKCGMCTTVCSHSKLKLSRSDGEQAPALFPAHAPNPQRWMRRPYEWIVLVGCVLIIASSFSYLIIHWDQSMERFCLLMVATFVLALLVRLVVGKAASFTTVRTRETGRVNG